MLVDGAGQLKMTKDGKVLLSEMQIQVSSLECGRELKVLMNQRVGVIEPDSCIDREDSGRSR